MKGCDSTIEHMDLDSTLIAMALNMLDNGCKINRMGLENKHGLMVLNTKENISMEKNMAKGSFYGATKVSMKVISAIMTFMDLESILGMMEGNSTENGKGIKWMEEAFSVGVTEGSTKESMWMIRKKAMEFLLGEMEESIKGCGLMENNMVEECTLLLMVFRKKVSGKKGRKLF